MSKRRSHAGPHGRGRQGSGDAAAEDTTKTGSQDRTEELTDRAEDEDVIEPQGEQEETMGRRTTPLRQDVERIGDDFRKLGSHARELAGDATEYARERAAAVPELTRAWVHERPLQSLAIAVGVGALLGLLLFRRD